LEGYRLKVESKTNQKEPGGPLRLFWFNLQPVTFNLQPNGQVE
jgi:hypothetical protein